MDKIKPIVPNEIFKETVESLNRKETEFYLLVRNEYSFDETQRNMVESKYNNLIES